jgi:hypothetical protein
VRGRGFAPAHAFRGQCSQDEVVKETLELINQMQADGVIGQYAIGGAVGALLYLEPAATLDIDIFVALPASQSGLLSLSPIYEYLKARGCAETHDHIIVCDWPVQFIEPKDELEHEAVAEAVTESLEGTPTRIMSAEHLVAIALRTGRSKDQNRILQFLEQRAVDRAKLGSLLERHQLTSKWKEFECRYPEAANG